jgi:hypothetical protein
MRAPCVSLSEVTTPIFDALPRIINPQTSTIIVTLNNAFPLSAFEIRGPRSDFPYLFSPLLHEE